MCLTIKSLDISDISVVFFRGIPRIPLKTSRWVMRLILYHPMTSETKQQLLKRDEVESILLSA